MKKNDFFFRELKVPGLQKVLRTMKLTIFLLLISVISVFANKSYSQTKALTLNMKNSTVKEVLQNIENQSDFHFMFSERLIDVKREVSVDVKNKKIEAVLDELFAGTDVNYKVKDRFILLTTPEGNDVSVKQQKSISGRVLDSSGSPLPGVTVVVKGTTNGTITDFEGNYNISNVPGDGTLVFSFVGMKPQEISVAGKSVINVTMDEETTAIDEVVAVGYGTRKKVNLSGAVSQATSEVLKSRSMVNLGQGLQGAVSGLQVTQGNFSPGQGASFNIRGYTSLNGGTPLILVDGVIQDPNLLNPEDIENVSVLKDASSAAIYGARAAYGVILITTKKGGRDQRSTVRFSSSYAVTTVTTVPKYASGYEFVTFVNEANKNTTGSPFYDQRAMDHINAYYKDPVNNLPVYYDPVIDLTGKYNYCGNTDWASAVYKSGAIKQINASLSGGTEKTQYYVSYGFMGQDGMLNVYDDLYKRNNVNINVNSDVFNWLTISTRMKYASAYQDHPSQGPTNGQLNWDLSPLMPIKLPSGAWSGQGDITNPFAVAREGGYDHTKVNDLFLTGAITIHPVKGLNINVDYTYNPYSSNHDNYVRSFLEERADGSTSIYPWTNPSAITNDNTNNYYNAINAYADYSKSISKNKFKILVGYNKETQKTKFFSAQRFQLINNDLPAINRATGTQAVNGSASLWAIQGAFFRLNYDYDNKYLLELNGRYDGSSKFPKGNRYDFFPSVSGAWVISNESFWGNFKPYVNTLKIRGSYGSLGNQNVTGDFPYVSSYSITTAPTTAQSEANIASYILGGSTPVAILPGSLVSPNFTWEKVNQWNVGTDLGLINNKLTVSFNVFQRATIGMLTAGQTLPSVLGTGVPRENAADLKTSGWDLEAGWKNKTGDFSYGISANLSDAQTEITKFSNPTNLLSSNYVGQKIGEIWGYDAVGLFQSTAEVASWADQSQFYSGTWNPGDVKYVDRNGDGKITRGLNTLSDPGDQHIIGNNTPRYQYGVILNGAWKGFDLNIFIQGVGKRQIWFTEGWMDQDRFFGTNGATGFVPMKLAMDYWTTENTDAFLPKNYLSGWGSGGHGNRQVSSRYLQNAAYMRLKQVTLGYTVPENMIKKASISHLRIYCALQNILTFTKLSKIYDPEVTNTSSYPAPLSYSLGIDLTF